MIALLVVGGLFVLGVVGLAVAGVWFLKTDKGQTLVGMISDGDLRRQIERHGYTLLDRTAAQCMTTGAVVITREQLATAGLAVMEERRITSLPVVDAGRVVGVLHLHDLWKTEMI